MSSGSSATVDVDEGIAKLKAAAPEAVVIVGPYLPVATIVKKAKAAHFTPKFLTVSFVGTAEFIKEAGAYDEGVYITRVMPAPDDASASIVKQFQVDLKGGDLSYSTLEGYIDAVVLVEALKKAGKDLTRESFQAAMESLNADVGGLPVVFSQSRHQGMSQVWMMQIKGGQVELLSGLGLLSRRVDRHDNAWVNAKEMNDV